MCLGHTCYNSPSALRCSGETSSALGTHKHSQITNPASVLKKLSVPKLLYEAVQQRYIQDLAWGMEAGSSGRCGLSALYSWACFKSGALS